MRDRYSVTPIADRWLVLVLCVLGVTLGSAGLALGGDAQEQSMLDAELRGAVYPSNACLWEQP